MTGALTILGAISIALGIAFLLLAALALWRLPDVFTRLHALTKADTAGVALVALGAGLIERDARVAVVLVIVVLLVAISGATAGHLIARLHLQHTEKKHG